MDIIMKEEAHEEGDFVVNEKDKIVNLTERGIEKVEQFFHIENLADPENLEIQLRKISKTYEGLLAQKDQIIEKQDENINLLLKEKDEMMKSNKTTIITLKRQNDNYRQLLEKYEYLLYNRYQ